MKHSLATKNQRKHVIHRQQHLHFWKDTQTQTDSRQMGTDDKRHAQGHYATSTHRAARVS